MLRELRSWKEKLSKSFQELQEAKDEKTTNDKRLHPKGCTDGCKVCVYQERKDILASNFSIRRKLRLLERTRTVITSTTTNMKEQEKKEQEKNDDDETHMFSPVRMFGGGPGEDDQIPYDEWTSAMEELDGENYKNFKAGQVIVCKW